MASVKRHMGSQEPVPIAGQELLPQEISALILKELKNYVDARFGEGEKEAVITVPAYFTDDQRRATKQAGELAGFVVERIINEPTAAALAFGLANLDEDKHILVYDLGGGTFDVSVVEMMSGLLEVKASTGNSRLGGEDFDWRIVDWLAERFREEHGFDPLKDIQAKALLKEEAEKAKLQLSTEESVTVSMPVVSLKDNRPVGLLVKLTRVKFVELIEDLLSETMDSVSKVLKDASLSPQDIDEILLVGGSSRIPEVRKLIHGFFGKDPRADVNPDEAVALGAAVQAGLKSGALAGSGLVVTDVAPFSMGIAVLKEWKGDSLRPGGFHAIIPRNTTIPVTRTEEFYTSADNQTRASIEIYQGENEWVKHNHLLGEFVLSGIPRRPAGSEALAVTYSYNLNGILEVKACCVSNGKEMSVTIQDALDRDSQTAFEASRARLEELQQNAESIDENDEEWDSFDEYLDIDGESDEAAEDAPAVLHEEALALRERAEKLIDALSGEDLAQAQKVIAMLDEAVAKDNIDLLKTVIDEAADILINLEF